ncbi:MAG TPA: hypothetical protein VHI98_20390 [Vicinamibacterales bacterium]|jgi:hypothetical protein|nr:hypothetical protein [Vicinamibacterales bacterium]
MSNAERRDVAAYYTALAVRRRILEYCGALEDAAPTAIYVAGIDPSWRGADARWEVGMRVPASRIGELFERGADIARSLWDRENLLVHLDLDYQNTDYEGEAFSHPAEAFFRLEPVYRVIRQECGKFGLPLYCLMTGCGYHFTGRVALASPVLSRLAALPLGAPAWHGSVAARRPPGCPEVMTETHAKAYLGLGRVVEYLAHRVLRRAEALTSIPVVFNGTVVGSGVRGRAAVSIDFSYFGDPLDARHIRVAFGGYQTHRLREDIVGPRLARTVAPMAAVPRAGRGLLGTLRLRDLDRAAGLAGRTQVALPEVSAGVDRLVTEYSSSSLAAFHRSFDDSIVRGRDAWAASGRVDPRGVPPCVAWPLQQPNDRLLQPAFIQHVTRGLMSTGWDPADIARLVFSRYASDAAWGHHWSLRDRWARAEFDVRIFAGLVRAGLDEAVDFNCVSAQEKGLCPGADCRLNLLDARHQLLEHA